MTYQERLAYEERILAAEMEVERVKRLVPQPHDPGSYVGDVFYPVGGTEASHRWNGEKWEWITAYVDVGLSKPASVAGEAVGLLKEAHVIVDDVFQKARVGSENEREAGDLSKRIAKFFKIIALTTLSKPTPVEAGALERLTQVASGCMLEAVYGREWCAFPDVEIRKDLRAILAALSETQPPRETSTQEKQNG